MGLTIGMTGGAEFQRRGHRGQPDPFFQGKTRPEFQPNFSSIFNPWCQPRSHRKSMTLLVNGWLRFGFRREYANK
jgi:hypothetical protein